MSVSKILPPGVTLTDRKKPFMARKTLSHCEMFLGTFNTPAEALAAREAAERVIKIFRNKGRLI